MLCNRPTRRIVLRSLCLPVGRLSLQPVRAPCTARRPEPVGRVAVVRARYERKPSRGTLGARSTHRSTHRSALRLGWFGCRPHTPCGGARRGTRKAAKAHRSAHAAQARTSRCPRAPRRAASSSCACPRRRASRRGARHTLAGRWATRLVAVRVRLGLRLGYGSGSGLRVRVRVQG